MANRTAVKARGGKVSNAPLVTLKLSPQMGTRRASIAARSAEQRACGRRSGGRGEPAAGGRTRPEV